MGLHQTPYPVPDHLDDERLRRFFDYWHSGFDAGLPPPRSAFDPLHVRELMGLINIAKVLRDGDAMRFHFTLWGTQNCTLYGGDFTGRYLDEIMLPTEQGSVQDAFEHVVRNSTPHFWRVSVPRPNREFAFYKRLALPYRDKTGPEISHVIALMIADQGATESEAEFSRVSRRGTFITDR